MTAPINRYYLRSVIDTDTEESDSEIQENCTLEDSLNLSDLGETEAEDTVIVATLEEEVMASAIHPPKFNGDSGSRASNWLKQYENYAKLTKMNPESKLLTLPFFLEGKAKRWYDALSEAIQDSYDDLIAALGTRFDGDDGINQGFGLWALSRLPSESVDDYILRVQSFGNTVPETFLVSAAMKGLSPELQRIVMPQTNIKSLEDLRVATTLAERTVLCTNGNPSATVNSAMGLGSDMPAWVQRLSDQIQQLTFARPSQPDEPPPATYSRRQYEKNSDNRRGRNQQPQQHQQQQRRPYACRNCRGMVPHSLPQCPAYNLRCTNCNGMHHTAAVCEKTMQKGYRQ